jgi:hypothetical protein
MMMQNFEMRYVRGHVEVYDRSGEFIFSADTMSEARDEIRDLLA